MNLEAPSPARPSAPDRGLLEKAAVRYASLLGRAGSDVVVWEVGDRMDRPRSSVFPMHALAGGRPIGTAFYKVMHPSTKGEPDRHELRVDRARSSLERTMELDDRLASLLEREQIEFSRSLAVDPETLTIITIGVSGVPLGGISRHLRTPASRRDASQWMELTGRAARLIEECTTGEVEDREDERAELLARRIERVEPWVSSEVADGLRGQVAYLYQQATEADQPIIYAHGDFSPTNLLVDTGIGLIDFEWVPRLRHFDLANLVFRLEFDTGLPERIVRPMVSAALNGYGLPDVVATPNWGLHRISNLLKVVRYGSRPWYQPLSGRTRRAFAELESLAGRRLSSR